MNYRKIRRSYKRAANKGTAVPAGEREGSSLEGKRYSSIKDYKESRAANEGMAQASPPRGSWGITGKEFRKDARDLAQEDTRSIKQLRKAGANRLTVRGKRSRRSN